MFTVQREAHPKLTADSFSFKMLFFGFLIILEVRSKHLQSDDDISHIFPPSELHSQALSSTAYICSVSTLVMSA